MTPQNVVLFGEAGAGKSSIINMLLGQRAAPTSSGAAGCTFSSDVYDIRMNDVHYSIHDTVGLNEARHGTVVDKTAVKHLYSLVRRLHGGVHLLVFVMRAKRITTNIVKNYKLFSEAIFGGFVPVVIIITGLEGHEPMDSWWVENEFVFDRYRMVFADHACITATRGKLIDGAYPYEAEYEASRKAVKRIIVDNCQERGWKMERARWLRELLKATHTLLKQSSPAPAVVWNREDLETSLTESGVTQQEVLEIVGYVHPNSNANHLRADYHFDAYNNLNKPESQKKKWKIFSKFKALVKNGPGRTTLSRNPSQGNRNRFRGSQGHSS